MRLRAAVARLLDTTPSEPLELLPGLPPTREQQQQARRLAEATAVATARVKEALEPPKPPATKPRAKDARKAWVRQGCSRCDGVFERKWTHTGPMHCVSR